MVAIFAALVGFFRKESNFEKKFQNIFAIIEFNQNRNISIESVYTHKKNITRCLLRA